MSHEPLLETGLSLLLPVLGAVYLGIDGVEVKVVAELLFLSFLPSVIIVAVIADMTIGLQLLNLLPDSPLIVLALGGMPVLLAGAIFFLFVTGNDWRGMKRMLILFGMSYLGQALFMVGIFLIIQIAQEHAISTL